jgi:hypothetical protein
MALGSGDWRYEIVEGWGALPAGVAFGPTVAVAADSADRVYVHNRSTDAVLVFDREGNFLRSWGESFRDGAHGMCCHREAGGEFLYFADAGRHLACKTTLEGVVVWWRGAPERPDIYGAPLEYQPTDVCVAPDGDVFVADGRGKGWVHQYDREAHYVRSFGGPAGPEPGRTRGPHALVVDVRRRAAGEMSAEPELYVADRGPGRLQVFTLAGEHKRFVTLDAAHPSGLRLFRDHLLVCDPRGRVLILDKDDRLAIALGDEAEGADRPLHAPHAACADSRGDLYVVEWGEAGRVIKLRRL